MKVQRVLDCFVQHRAQLSTESGDTCYFSSDTTGSAAPVALAFHMCLSVTKVTRALHKSARSVRLALVHLANQDVVASDPCTKTAIVMTLFTASIGRTPFVWCTSHAPRMLREAGASRVMEADPKSCGRRPGQTFTSELWLSTQLSGANEAWLGLTVCSCGSTTSHTGRPILCGNPQHNASRRDSNNFPFDGLPPGV